MLNPKIILLFLLIFISYSQTLLIEEGVAYESIEIGSNVQYHKGLKNFKFDYSGDKGKFALFIFRYFSVEFYLLDENQNRIKIDYEYLYRNDDSFVYQVNLTYDGTYYIELEFDKGYLSEIGGTFRSFIPGKIDELDLSKSYYYEDFEFYSDVNYGYREYEISNLKEEKYVYFLHFVDYYNEYTPFYDDESHPICKPYFSYDNVLDCDAYSIFEVCNKKTNECTFEQFYKFEKDTEYNIKVHYMKLYEPYYQNKYPSYRYPKYIIIPLTNNNLKKIDSTGEYSCEEPTFYIIKSNGDKDMYTYIEGIDLAKFNKTDNEISNLEDLISLQFVRNDYRYNDYSKYDVVTNDANYMVAFVFSINFKVKFYLLDEKAGKLNETFYTIPKNTKKMVNEVYSKKNEFKSFSQIPVITSESKNMRYYNSPDDEKTNIIIQNFGAFPIYFDEVDKDYNINIKYYSSRFSFFAASNPYFYKTLYPYLAQTAKVEGIDIENYLKMTQMNLRINTKYLPIFEFYNFFVQELEIKLNLYIKQLFGTSEIFQCDGSSVDINDLSILTTPINKEKCENKKSLVNRLFSFDGTNIFSGYLGPDSYFDVYIEIDNDERNIDISPIMIKDLRMENTAKYLKKGVEYKLNFDANHLVKLEPGFDAKITITNELSTTTLSSQYPTASISGKNLKIKSENDDAMVYFLGRLPDYFAQVKIKNEKGKIAKISGLSDDDFFIIDFGFENYLPSSTNFGTNVKEEKIIYLDNWYNKLKTKLVKDEYLYIYYYSYGKSLDIKIEYLYNNINYATNEFNIFYVPKNDGENQEKNALVLDNSQIDIGAFSFHFCRETAIEFTFFDKIEKIEKTLNFTSELYDSHYKTNASLIPLFIGDNLFTFTSNQSFVLSYLPVDNFDPDFEEESDLWKYREVLDDLTIVKVEGKKDSSNIINLEFKPNYVNSTARYIIIIASETDEHKDNFDDPCYITKLLQDNQNDIVVDKTYSIGDTDTITTEVDISKIINKNGKYIVNIISQEMRFNKTINFYKSMEFEYNGKEIEPDTSDIPSDEPSEFDDFVEIRLGSTVEYDKYNNKFMFNYKEKQLNIRAYFVFKIEVLFKLYDEDGNEYTIERERGYTGRKDLLYPVNITYNGKYYIEVESLSGIIFDIGSIFTTFLPGQIIEFIDLSKSYYNSNIDFIANEYYGTGIYFVEPKEDKYVIFVNSIFKDRYDYNPSYPYYNDSINSRNLNKEFKEEEPYPDSDEYKPDGTDTADESELLPEPTDAQEEEKEKEKEPQPYIESDAYESDEKPSDEPDQHGEDEESIFDTGFDISWSNETIFEVCISGTNECTKNVRLYAFKKYMKYEIHIHFIKIDYQVWDYEKYEYIMKSDYRYIRYIFAPISNDNIVKVNENNAFYLTNEPKLYVINPGQKNDINIWSQLVGFGYYAISSNDFTDILDIMNLEFYKAKRYNTIPKNNINYIIIFAFSLNYDSPVIFSNEYRPILNSTTIPPETSIYFERFEIDEENYVGHYNYIPVYKSKEKNMMYAITEKPEEKVDTIFQNYILFPMFIEKLKEQYELNVVTYKPKYALFGAIDPYLFESSFSYLKLVATSINLNPEKYHQITQMNLRINTKYLPWYEFYNLYLKEFKFGLNVYIKQLFGTSEIYECNADSVDINDLNILTTPISNSKCKDKKSIFNRLYTFDGTKILSGYLGPDSYFDIYAEFENNNTNIDISPVMQTELRISNAAKYLKKDVEYTINFFANHLVKLEPGFNAALTIYNGQTTVNLDSKHPVASISGKDFKIKSNNDAMVYFLGKINLPINQVLIDKEKAKGKIIKISNIPDENREIFCFDFGFEGYYPNTIPYIKQIIKDDGIIYLDNWYDKLQTPLVEGENLYIYYYAEKESNLKIEYIDKNINNKNNEFNIFLIPKNNGENDELTSLIIDTDEVRQGLYDVHFCDDNTNIEFDLDGHKYYFNKDEYSEYEKNRKINDTVYLSKGSNYINFKTNQPFVFSYSFYDMTDEEFVEKNFLKDRIEKNNSVISEVKNKSDIDNIITIKFEPNYVNSSTRYIILIASEDEQNTLDNMNNPCYVTQLLNERPKNVLVDKIYSIGDEEIISAEVDITPLLTEDNKYIITIISQELRFNKGIKFYTSKEFEYKGKIEPIPDISDDTTSDDIPSDDSTSDNIPSDDSTSDSTSDQGRHSPPDDKDDGMPTTSLVLAITLPIVGVLIIVAVILIIRAKRKRGIDSNMEIEKLTESEMSNV